MQQELILSGSPHIKSNQSTTRIMLDVLIALIPACVAAVYFFGIGCITVSYPHLDVYKRQILPACFIKRKTHSESLPETWRGHKKKQAHNIQDAA